MLQLIVVADQGWTDYFLKDSMNYKYSSLNIDQLKTLCEVIAGYYFAYKATGQDCYRIGMLRAIKRLESAKNEQIEPRRLAAWKYW